jgi:hypothetical protein
MATMNDISNGAREMLRDFPLFFEVDLGPLNTLSIRLPHPLINGDVLSVYLYDATVPVPTSLTTDWQLDARNGILKLTDNASLGKRVIINGYHYSWFLDSDLSFHANQVWGEMSYYDDMSLAGLQPAEAEVVMMGTVVHALWSLSIELALDIDVYTPEGMNIPARQRYTQVLQMLGQWEAEYQSKASMMNMGLGGLSQFRLRRVAYMTGRYVPVYIDREFDDPRPPERVYPEIPTGEVGGQLVQGGWSVQELSP